VQVRLTRRTIASAWTTDRRTLRTASLDVSAEIEDPKSPMARPARVLFVCTGNSARSLMAEALLRREAGDAAQVFSAGVDPRGINPLTARALDEIGVDRSGLRSKPVAEFLGQSFDFVITVCDNARESCPVFPGAGETLHWSLEDPAAATGSEAARLAVFERVRDQIAERVRDFVPAVVARA
jgi:arsenate reductase